MYSRFAVDSTDWLFVRSGRILQIFGQNTCVSIVILRNWSKIQYSDSDQRELRVIVPENFHSNGHLSTLLTDSQIRYPSPLAIGFLSRRNNEIAPISLSLISQSTRDVQGGDGCAVEVGRRDRINCTISDTFLSRGVASIKQSINDLWIMTVWPSLRNLCMLV